MKFLSRNFQDCGSPLTPEQMPRFVGCALRQPAERTHLDTELSKKTV